MEPRIDNAWSDYIRRSREWEAAAENLRRIQEAQIAAFPQGDLAEQPIIDRVSRTLTESTKSLAQPSTTPSSAS